MKFLNNRKVNYKYLFVIGISLLLSFAVTSLRLLLYVENTNPEQTIAIREETDITQHIYIQNSKKLTFRILVSCKAECAKLVARISQGNEEIVQEIPLNTIPQSSWEFIHINLKNLHNGEALLSLTTAGFEQGDRVNTLLTGGKDFFNLPDVSINGIRKEDKRLELWYDTFDWKLFWSSLGVFLVVNTVLYLSAKKFTFSLSRNKIIILGCFLLVVKCINSHLLTLPISGWASTLHFYTYKYGFVSRAFAGTCLWTLKKIFTGNSFISEKFFRFYSIIIFFFLSGITFFSLQKLIHHTKDKVNSKMVSLIALFYLCSPFSVVSYANLLGRVDMLLGICFILCCLCILYEKQIFCIPLLSCIGISMHQMFTFSYLPILLSLILFYGIVEKKKNFLIIFLVTTVLSGFLAVYYQYYGNPHGFELEEIISQMQSRTDMHIGKIVVETEWFFDTQKYYDWYRSDYFRFNVLFHTITNILLVSPIIFIKFRILYKSFTGTTNIVTRFCIICIALAPVFSLLLILYTPAFDMGRWFLEFSIATTFCIILLITKNTELVANASRTTYTSLVNKFGEIPLVILAMAYLALGGCNTLAADFSTNMISPVKNIITKVLREPEFTKQKLAVQENILGTDTAWTDGRTQVFMQTHGEQLEQEFSVAEDIEVKNLIIRAITWNYEYGEHTLTIYIERFENSLRSRITNKERTPVYTEKIPLSRLQDNTVTEIPLKDCNLPAGTYRITLDVDGILPEEFGIAANPKQHKSIIYNGQDIKDTELCLELQGIRYTR